MFLRINANIVVWVYSFTLGLQGDRMVVIWWYCWRRAPASELRSQHRSPDRGQISSRLSLISLLLFFPCCLMFSHLFLNLRTAQLLSTWRWWVGMEKRLLSWCRFSQQKPSGVVVASVCGYRLSSAAGTILHIIYLQMWCEYAARIYDINCMCMALLTL